MNICLCKMTKELARKYYKYFEMDPCLFLDMRKFQPYIYSEEKADATVDRNQQLGRVFMAIMQGDEPIGEVILKNIDLDQKACTLGIHMQNDTVKNKGYGTQAEVLAIQYAFDKLKLDTVYADAIHKNKRSRHVLQKVGFQETHQDDQFIYYECRKATWMPPNL